MKKLIFCLIIFTAITIGCGQTSNHEDPEILKQVLFEYFEGIKNKDLERMNDVTTSDFVLFEDGKVWNNDSLFNLLHSMPDYVAEYEFSHINIEMENKVGYMVYFNHMDITLSDTIKQQYDWIESATFKKIDGVWKLNFLHSTVRK